MLLAAPHSTRACTTPSPGRIDSFSIVYGSDRDYYVAMAPTTLAAKNVAKVRQQAIRIICGTEDYALLGATFVHDELDEARYPA